MMREWDVAGRCCAGRGWCCAMAWIFWCYGFHTSAAEFCKKKMAPFGQVKILLQSLADGKEPLEVAWVLNELKYFFAVK